MKDLSCKQLHLLQYAKKVSFVNLFSVISGGPHD